MLNRLTNALEFHGQALALRSERQRLLASNIANADTPGYLARDINFGQTLRDATAGRTVSTTMAQAGAGNGTLATTQVGHLGGGVSTVSLGQNRLLYATPAQSNLDGNSVDMDRERANFADNAVKYEASLRFINGNVRTMLDAIKGQS